MAHVSPHAAPTAFALPPAPQQAQAHAMQFVQTLFAQFANAQFSDQSKCMLLHFAWGGQGCPHDLQIEKQFETVCLNLQTQAIQGAGQHPNGRLAAQHAFQQGVRTTIAGNLMGPYMMARYNEVAQAVSQGYEPNAYMLDWLSAQLAASECTASIPVNDHRYVARLIRHLSKGAGGSTGGEFAFVDQARGRFAASADVTVLDQSALDRKARVFNQVLCDQLMSGLPQSAQAQYAQIRATFGASYQHPNPQFASQEHADFCALADSLEQGASVQATATATSTATPTITSTAASTATKPAAAPHSSLAPAQPRGRSVSNAGKKTAVGGTTPRPRQSTGSRTAAATKAAQQRPAKTVDDAMEQLKDPGTHTINLAGRRLRDSAVRKLVDEIKARKRSIGLDLSGNSIGKEGVAAIAELLKSDQLFVLNLSNNKIGNEGAQILSKALACNKNLQVLDIQSCGIKDEKDAPDELGGMSILGLTEMNSSLKQLDFSGNQIDDFYTGMAQRLVAENLDRQKALNKDLVNSAFRRDLEAMKRCVADGADVNYRLPNGQFALWRAVEGGFLDGVAFLLDQQGTDVNQRGYDDKTPLRCARENQNLETVKLLLLRGASLGAGDNEEIALAEKAGWYNMEALLTKVKSNRKALLQEAQRCIGNKDAAGLKAVMAKDYFDVNFGSEPILVSAASASFADGVKLILEHKNVDVNVRRASDGSCALSVSCRQGDAETRQLLLEHPDIDVGVQDNEGNTPLQIAIEFNRPRTVKTLLEKGALESDNYFQLVRTVRKTNSPEAEQSLWAGMQQLRNAGSLQLKGDNPDTTENANAMARFGVALNGNFINDVATASASFCGRWMLSDGHFGVSGTGQVICQKVLSDSKARERFNTDAGMLLKMGRSSAKRTSSPDAPYTLSDLGASAYIAWAKAEHDRGSNKGILKAVQAFYKAVLPYLDHIRISHDMATTLRSLIGVLKDDKRLKPKWVAELGRLIDGIARPPGKTATATVGQGTPVRATNSVIWQQPLPAPQSMPHGIPATATTTTTNTTETTVTATTTAGVNVAAPVTAPATHPVAPSNAKAALIAQAVQAMKENKPDIALSAVKALREPAAGGNSNVRIDASAAQALCEVIDDLARQGKIDQETATKGFADAWRIARISDSDRALLAAVAEKNFPAVVRLGKFGCEFSNAVQFMCLGDGGVSQRFSGLFNGPTPPFQITGKGEMVCANMPASGGNVSEFEFFLTIACANRSLGRKVSNDVSDLCASAAIAEALKALQSGAPGAALDVLESLRKGSAKAEDELDGFLRVDTSAAQKIGAILEQCEKSGKVDNKLVVELRQWVQKATRKSS
jgi:ankyrin repeat protein